MGIDKEFRRLIVTLSAIVGTFIIISLGLWIFSPKAPEMTPTSSQLSGVNILQGSTRTFKQDVLECKVPVIVDFWAPWCGPCRSMAPILEEFVQKESEVRLVKINVDENAELSQHYQVTAIPTLIFFRNGKEISRSIGVIPRNELERRLHEDQ